MLLSLVLSCCLLVAFFFPILCLILLSSCRSSSSLHIPFPPLKTTLHPHRIKVNKLSPSFLFRLWSIFFHCSAAPSHHAPPGSICDCFYASFESTPAHWTWLAFGTGQCQCLGGRCKEANKSSQSRLNFNLIIVTYIWVLNILIQLVISLHD